MRIEYCPSKAYPAPHAIDSPRTLIMKSGRKAAINIPKITDKFDKKIEYFLPIISERVRRIRVVNVLKVNRRVNPPILSSDLSHISP